ncbi:MAG TPA: hypothetical protein VKZ53_24085 [Candidatus Angelobacter sp.]|nr:hypothetical protein [Candidatus Angelobacter sp.]
MAAPINPPQQQTSPRGTVDPERERLLADIREWHENLKTAPHTDQAGLRSAITENGKLLAEHDKIVMEREKIALERKKAAWTAIGVLGSFVTIMVTVLSTFSSLSAQQKALIVEQKTTSDQISAQIQISNEQAKEQWDLKAADILLASEDGAQFDLRLATLKSLFPDRSQRLGQLAQTQDDRSQRLRKKGILMHMIAEHPDQSRNILTAWHALFGGDKWVADVEKQVKNTDVLAVKSMSVPSSQFPKGIGGGGFGSVPGYIPGAPKGTNPTAPSSQNGAGQ